MRKTIERNQVRTGRVTNCYQGACGVEDAPRGWSGGEKLSAVCTCRRREIERLVFSSPEVCRVEVSKVEVSRVEMSRAVLFTPAAKSLLRAVAIGKSRGVIDWVFLSRLSSLTGNVSQAIVGCTWCNRCLPLVSAFRLERRVPFQTRRHQNRTGRGLPDRQSCHRCR